MACFEEFRQLKTLDVSKNGVGSISSSEKRYDELILSKEYAYYYLADGFGALDTYKQDSDYKQLTARNTEKVLFELFPNCKKITMGNTTYENPNQ